MYAAGIDGTPLRSPWRFDVTQTAFRGRRSVLRLSSLLYFGSPSRELCLNCTRFGGIGLECPARRGVEAPEKLFSDINRGVHVGLRAVAAFEADEKMPAVIEDGYIVVNACGHAFAGGVRPAIARQRAMPGTFRAGEGGGL